MDIKLEQIFPTELRVPRSGFEPEALCMCDDGLALILTSRTLACLMNIPGSNPGLDIFHCAGNIISSLTSPSKISDNISNITILHRCVVNIKSFPST